MVTLTMYAVAVGALKRIQLKFQLHTTKFLSCFYHVLNKQYETHLFDSDLTSLFEGIDTKTEFEDDAPKLLHAYFIVHIKIIVANTKVEVPKMTHCLVK